MDAAHLSRIYLAKATAELAEADALLPGSEKVRCRGAVIAVAVLVCGEPEPSDAETGEALSGPVGEAASRALEALDEAPHGAATRRGIACAAAVQPTNLARAE